MSPEEILLDDLTQKLDLLEGQITRLASLRHNATVQLSEKVRERDRVCRQLTTLEAHLQKEKSGANADRQR